MEQSETHRTTTNFFSKEKKCSQLILEFNASSVGRRKLSVNKQNEQCINGRHMFVPSLKARTTDRNNENQRLSTRKFKNLLTNIHFFNIRQVSIQPRPQEELLKTKKIISSTAVYPEPLKIDGLTRKSLNIRKSFVKQIEDKEDSSFVMKLRNYHENIQKVWLSNNIVKHIPTNYKEPLRVTIKPGNNSKLVKNIMRKRWWWSIENNSANSHFIWSQLKDKNIFSNKPQIMSQVHNHLENNNVLGNKKQMYYSLRSYFQSICDDVFSYVPLTFHVTSTQGQSYQQFLNYFQQQKKKKGKVFWIVKPGEFTNRGKGISIHKEITQIQSILKQSQYHPDGRPKTFIIQEYIEKPFLYNRRKFDIRCYMVLTLLNGSLKGYWYQLGYIRTSSSQFQLGNFNTNIHLTNDAVQKYSQTYGKFEAGNKLSYYEFQKYLDIKHPNKYNFKDVYLQMKAVAKAAIEATHKTIGGSRKPGLFEIFGLDFMIDESFKPWLIEINTNPCLETSCPVLERVIPNLLEDTLKLCLDPLFPPPTDWPASRKHQIDCCSPSKLELIFDQAKSERSKASTSGRLKEININ